MNDDFYEETEEIDTSFNSTQSFMSGISITNREDILEEHIEEYGISITNCEDILEEHIEEYEGISIISHESVFEEQQFEESDKPKA